MSSVRSALSRLRPELTPTLSLAWPVILGHLGVMLMSLVDTLAVGQLGRAAIGAVSVGSAVYYVAFAAGLGMLLGVDHVAAVAYGAGDRREIAHTYVQGLYVAAGASLPLMAALFWAASRLPGLGIDPALVPGAQAFLRVVALSIGPVLLFNAARQTLQALGDTRAAMVILLAANGVNFAVNQLLVTGRWGAPALGVAGSAWATVLSRVFMMLALLGYAARKGLRLRDAGLGPDPARLQRLLKLGLPASVQLVLEGGVFSVSSLLMARIGAGPAAAHQVVLQIASFTFMVPLGLSAAGTVRVGQSLGRGALVESRRAGWAAVLLGAAFMLASGLTLLLAWRPLLGLFSLDPEVLTLAHALLFCAALFQLFDGLQVTLSGALRGLGDTLSPMVANLIGHWLIGLPVGCLFAFVLRRGAVGMWIGLATGLAAVALGLIGFWHRRSRTLSLERIFDTSSAHGHSSTQPTDLH